MNTRKIKNVSWPVRWAMAVVLYVSLLPCGLLQAQESKASNIDSGEQRLSVSRLQKWESLGYGMFIHFGMSTFDEAEMSKGDMPSTYYAPEKLDVEQWIRTAHDAGMKYAILTTKHVSGHCLWPSKYTDYDVNKQRYTLEQGYTLSPYDLIWDGDYYYVRGFCDERQAMRNFRVDRIKEVPALLNEAAVIKPVDYNLPDYDKAVFRMFDTDKPIEVELLCNVNMMKYLIDNFGADFESEVIDENAFKARIFVCTSTTFYRWVFGFKGSIKK